MINMNKITTGRIHRLAAERNVLRLIALSYETLSSKVTGEKEKSAVVPIFIELM